MRHMKSAVTGTLQEKNGKFYLVLRIPDSTGKLHQKWVSTGLPVQGNQRRAKQLLDAKLVELQADYDRRSRQAGWAVAEVGEVPFDEVVRRWMTRKRSEVAPSTFEGYEHITARLLPYFRKLDLTMDEISPTVLESYCEFLSDAGLSANTVQHHLTLIRSVFNDEIRNGAPILNPVKCVKAPRVETFQGETLSVEQIEQLFRLFEGDPIEDIVRIGVIYGLRRSEVLGIRWSAIDDEKGTLSINHKVTEGMVDGRHQIYTEDKLKTKSSFRTLPLIPAVRALLDEQRARQEEYRRLFKKSYCTEYLDYVCTDEMGRLFRPNYITDHFKLLLKQHGLRHIRFHDLRHSCASLLLSQGIPMKQIQEWLGHSTFATTADIYSHLDFNSKLESAQAISDAFAAEPESALAL